MKYIKLQNFETIIDDLINSIVSKLNSGNAVLLLLSGGSAIDLAAKMGQQLKDYDLSKLHITLMDERYGPVGHPGSNWQQLQIAGFKANGAHLYPVLSGRQIEKTNAEFSATLEELFGLGSYVIGLFGMGADGHTAGLLPGIGSINKTIWSDYFTGPDFQRITMTPWSLAKVDQAILYAVGEQKHPALKKLSEKIDVNTQPVQLLKQIPNVTIYNDYKEGEI